MIHKFSDEIKHHFSEVIDSVAKIGGWVVDLSTHSIQWSRQTYEIHELDEGDHISLAGAIDYFLPSYRSHVRDLYYAASLEGKPFSFVAQINTHKQKSKWVKVHGKPIFNDKGHPKSVVGIFEDVTQRVSDFNKIESQQQFLKSIVDNIFEGLIVLDEQGVIRSCNASACTIFGYNESEVLGQNASMLMPEPQASRHNSYLQSFQRSSLANMVGLGRELRGKKKDQSTFPLYLSISEVQMHGKKHFLGTIRELSLEKIHAEKIERLSNYDEYTGLPNRNFLRGYLSEAVIDQYIALVTVNIDRFKRIYLAHGLEKSNLVIKNVAERLESLNDRPALVCRDMADKFWLVFKASNCRDLEKILCRIKKQLEQPICIGGHNHYITASIGAVLAEPGISQISLLSKAELALYDAKSKGNGNFSLYKNSIQHEDILQAYNTERQLREAIEQDDLVFYLQPKHDRDGTLSSAEMLVRWQQRDGKILYPDEFIDIAEESGLIYQIGRKAIEHAAKMLAVIDNVNSDISLAVNISPAHFLSDDFVESLLEIFAENNVDLSRLVLEITENLLVSDFDLLKERTQILAAMGVKISIDDFGTGYSNLQRIQELTISEIKIDKSFTWKCSDQQGLELLNAMVNVGKSMQLDVVAEGVENQTHMDILMNLNIDEFQGYFYSKPIPFDHFMETLTLDAA